MKRAWVVCAVLSGTVFVSSAQALVIADNSGTGAPLNGTAPANDPGWNRTGTLGGGTGVYLGNGWVLTAAHVTTSGGTFTLGSDTYSYVAGTGHILNNPSGYGLTAQTDLWMGQYIPSGASNPFPGGVLPIRSTTPGTGTMGTMIGTGKTQSTQKPVTFYADHDVSPWNWSASTFPEADFSYRGFYYTGGRDKRWAVSPVSYLNGTLLNNYNISGRDVRGFGTIFSDADPNRGIVAVNDSGSPFFTQNGSTWELTGIAHALLLSFNGQGSDPDMASTVLYGNYSFYSDLSLYADQINALVVPEPGSVVMLVVLGAGALMRRRRGAGWIA